MTLAPLPVYPSRKGFSASQVAQFHFNLSIALARLPPEERNSPSTLVFLSTYASDASQQTLESLIWEDAQPTKKDDALHQRVLVLAEKVAAKLQLRTLLDLSVAFPFKITRLRSIMSAALSATHDLPAAFSSEVVPAFTLQLSPSRSSGLYGLRKTAHCLTSLLRPSPPALVRPFAHSKEFVIALARAYDDGLTAISRSYGGIRMGAADRELDHWEKLWLETKVDMVDAFHVILTTMVQDISSASGAALAVEADRTFDIVFALLDSQPALTGGRSADVVPFLDRPLVADYQYAYTLSGTLSSALRRASRDDGRMELLESTLRSLDLGPSGGHAKDPGALRLILRSSGIAPGASGKATQIVTQPASTSKGKAKMTTSEPTLPSDPDLDLKVAQVLDIFPDHSPEYIRGLLTHPSYPFRGNAERVIEALLEGTAPDEDTVRHQFSVNAPAMEAPMERRNVFDQEVMDLGRVHVGKKTQDGTSLARDKEEVQRMKDEILRRVEEMSVDSDEESGQPKALDVFDLDDDLEEVDASAVRVLGDGEDSGDEEINGERGVDPIKPETILELAYLRDPKLFNRDAETRRSKSRVDLKQQTGWADEQIEGWRIMLERNPKKERILQKHEFSGNRPMNVQISGASEGQPSGSQPSGGQRGGGRGRGGSRGRGRGRGRGEGTGGQSAPAKKNHEVARERAYKEKHKSSGRTRGYDRKMAKANTGPSV